MNSHIEISRLEDYINHISDFATSEKNHLYRGQEDAEWDVTSGVFRRLSPLYTRDAELFRSLCWGYLLQLVDEVQLEYPSIYRSLSPLECLAHLQHNGVATGLIDFTFNPLVALWFACAVGAKKASGKVTVLENDSARICPIKSIKELESGLENFLGPAGSKWHLWAPALDSRVVDTQRITRQYSVFLFGLPEVSNEIISDEIVIPHAHKAALITELAAVGISEETLFADPPGFWERNTSQHYYDMELIKPYYGEIL